MGKTIKQYYKSKIEYGNKLFLWLMIITCLISFMATYTMYHFPGERTIVLLLMGIVGLGNVHSMADRVYYRYVKVFIVLSLVPMLLTILIGSMPDLKIFLGIMFGSFFILLKDCYKYYIFEKFITILSILLLCSLVEFFILLFFDRGIHLGIVQRGGTDFYFHHYLFNMVKVGGVRFQSLCDEPAGVGSICGLLLFLLDGFRQFKKQFCIILLAGLVSLSFTFYVLLFIYFAWGASRFNYKTVLSAVVAIMIAMLLIGDNINHYIIERYQSGEYDDRASMVFKERFDGFLHSSDVWLGKGEGAVALLDELGTTVGFRREIYEYGVIGVFFIFLAFTIPYYRMSKKELYALSFFVIFCISYYASSNIYAFPKLLIFFSVPMLSRYRIVNSANKKSINRS